MFSIFNKNTIATAEEKTDLQQLMYLFEQLKTKEKDLKEQLGEDIGSLVYQKLSLIGQINAEIEKAINGYLKERKPTAISDSVAMLILVKKINNILGDVVTVEKNLQILISHRSKGMFCANAIFGAGSLVACVGIGMTAGPLLGFGFFLARPKLVETVAWLTGLDASLIPTSLRIILNIAKLNKYIETKLDIEIKSLGLNADMEINSLDCPITSEKMKHPVLCLLDGRMYEKEAIVKWLTENRTSPFNREAMKPGQRLQDVLIENISLREALEEFEQMKLMEQASSLGNEQPRLGT